MNLGSKLSVYRHKMNLTQEEVANKLHVSRTTISSWEVGRTFPDIEKLILLSQLYNFSLDELIMKENNIMAEIKIDQKKIVRYKIIKKVICVLLSLFLAYNIFWFISIYPKNKTLNSWMQTEASNYLNKDGYTFQAHKIRYADPLFFGSNKIEVATSEGTNFFMSIDKDSVHLMSYSSEGMEAIIDKKELTNSDFKILKGKFKDTNVSEIVNSHSGELKDEYNALEAVWKEVNNQ